MSDNPLENIGQIPGVVEAFIEKISDAIGGILSPWQIKRVAKAEAEAAIIRAEGEEIVSEIKIRAIRRFMNEEEIKQNNMESILGKAIPLLDKSSNPNDMNDDWIFNFFDKARMYSDEEVQMLWAKILAGKANTKGSFSRKTINLLSDLEKNDIMDFKLLCNFAWKHDSPFLTIYDYEDDIYRNNGVYWNLLKHIETLGLVNLYYMSGYEILFDEKEVIIGYGDQKLQIVFEDFGNNSNDGYELSIGKADFTVPGVELFAIVDTEVVDGFYDYVSRKINSLGNVHSVKKL